MAPIYVRGGQPYVVAQGTSNVPTTLQKWEFPQVANRLILSAATNAIRLYFSQDDATADANYYLIGAGVTIEWPAELGALWTKAQTGAADMTLVIFLVR